MGGRFSPRGGGFLDGPPEQWVEQLLPLAVEDGVDTFILASDDPGTMQRFAEEVAPALREAVALELGWGADASGETDAPGTAGPARIRSTAQLARRRPGIDYDAIPASLAASAVEPGDATFARVRSTYMRGGDPGLVLRPTTATQVAEAVGFAGVHHDRGIPLAIRSAGHGISGRSTNDGGIVIDLSALRAITVLDEASRLVRIEPGARWKDVAAFLEPHGWALTSGDYGGVGVGGLATAGGIGWLVREHGLTIDHLRAVELVLADGRIVRASETEEPDLFWAVRGAGSAVGIVTAFEFEVDEVGEVGWAQLTFDATDTEEFLQAWGDWIVDAPREVTSFLILGAPRPGQPTYAQVMAMVDLADPDEVVARLQPLAAAAPLVAQDVRMTTYRAVISNAGDESHSGQGEPSARSTMIGRITPEFARDATRFLESGATYFFQFRAAGGAVHDVPADATAFAHRDAEFSVVAFGSRGRSLDERFDELIAPHGEGTYVSFDTTRGADAAARAYPPATLERLRAIKAAVDPLNLFRDNADVVPTAPVIE
ncbi:FAD-binding protein [Agromyces sp. MMS24-K17]|uniref:FAD-binding oxidoreductase n=1 Tax=Agromyces sp. MMS24-K17 TaxID=3372850 RepID=UPI003753F371